MKVLITGGCGFLGSNLAARFLSMGEEVTVIDGLFRPGSEQNLAWLESQARPLQFQHNNIDTADAEAVEHVFTRNGKFDYVCHLAGQVAMTTSISNPRRDLMTNVIGSFNILESARKHSPDAFLAYSSTNKVYGDLEHINLAEGEKRFSASDYPNGFDESLPLDFASPYGCSKGSADQYFRDWFRNFGIRTVVFRHSSIYGGRQFSSYDQGWIGWFCLKALEQSEATKASRPLEAFTISGTGKQVRDVLHADDLIDLYVLAYENRQSAAGEIFNIGGGIQNSLSLLELFDLVGELVDMIPANGSQAPLFFRRLPRRQSDQDFFVADIAKAHRMFGFSPKVSPRLGVERMIAWVKESRTPLK